MKLALALSLAKVFQNHQMGKGMVNFVEKYVCIYRWRRERREEFECWSGENDYAWPW